MQDRLTHRHIRKGGRYRILGVISLIPAIAASFIAVKWTPGWPWWAYYLTFFPATLGYSVFLCCQLSESPRLGASCWPVRCSSQSRSSPL
jgi:hypothetical protein